MSEQVSQFSSFIDCVGLVLSFDPDVCGVWSCVLAGIIVAASSSKAVATASVSVVVGSCSVGVDTIVEAWFWIGLASVTATGAVEVKGSISRDSEA